MCHHLPLGGSHTIFTVLYCTTAKEHAVLHRPHSLLLQSLPAVCLKTRVWFRCLFVEIQGRYKELM